MAAVLAFTAIASPAYAPAGSTFKDLHVVARAKGVLIRPRHGRGAQVTCPSGDRVLSGGAYFHVAGQQPTPTLGRAAHTIDSYPVLSKFAQGEGWHADGFNMTHHRTLEMTVVARCTAVDIFGGGGGPGAALDQGMTTEIDAPCQAGQVPYAGGTHVGPDSGIQSIDPLGASAHQSSSVADIASDSWLATFANESSVRIDVGTDVACTLQLVAYEPVVQRTFDETGHGIGGVARCQKGSHVVTGGAFFHQRNHGIAATDADRAVVASSAPRGNNTGWYADGFAKEGPTDDFQLTVEAICLPN